MLKNACASDGMPMACVLINKRAYTVYEWDSEIITLRGLGIISENAENKPRPYFAGFKTHEDKLFLAMLTVESGTGCFPVIQNSKPLSGNDLTVYYFDRFPIEYTGSLRIKDTDEPGSRYSHLRVKIESGRIVSIEEIKKSPR